MDLERLELVFPATNHCINHLESLYVVCFYVWLWVSLCLSLCLCLNLCLSLPPLSSPHPEASFLLFQSVLLVLRQYKLETGGAFAASSLQGNQTILGDVMFSK